MQTGTALGLLVGGAVLLLATRQPRAAAIGPNGQPLPSPLNALNPFNWFQQQPAVNPAQIFGPQQQSYAPAYSPYQQQQGGFQNAGYSPYGSPGGYSPAGYSPAGYSPYGSPGGYQSAAYSPSGSPGGYQYAAWSPGTGYSPYGTYGGGSPSYNNGGGSPRYSYA